MEEKLLANEEAARQKQLGQSKQRLEKDVRREERISILKMKLKNGNSFDVTDSNGDDNGNEGCGLSPSEMAELNGLLKVRDNFEEQYDPLSFT